MAAAWLPLLVQVDPSSVDLMDGKGCNSTEFCGALVQHHSEMQ